MVVVGADNLGVVYVLGNDEATMITTPSLSTLADGHVTIMRTAPMDRCHDGYCSMHVMTSEPAAVVFTDVALLRFLPGGNDARMLRFCSHGQSDLPFES